MIRLSAEQIRAFEDIEMHRFIGRIVDELPGYRPEPVAGRTRATLFATADAAVERARVYGVETERGFWLYANIAVTMGCYFDMNPTLPWAAEILGDGAYLGDERMDDLWNATVDWCDANIAEGAYLPRAAYEAYLALPPASGRLEGRLRALLHDLWPARTAALSPALLDAFVTQTRDRAMAFGLRDPVAIDRYVLISYLAGFGFDSDPLHDWCQAPLDRIERDDDLAVALALDTGFRDHHLRPALAAKED